jgi:hypothetical protein
LDFYQRALARDVGEYVMLLGEGSFHQFHGGVASNAPKHQHPWAEFNAEFERIRGRSFTRVLKRPFYFGTFPNEAIDIAKISAQHGFELWRQAIAGGEA